MASFTLNSPLNKTCQSGCKRGKSFAKIARGWLPSIFYSACQSSNELKRCLKHLQIARPSQAILRQKHGNQRKLNEDRQICRQDCGLHPSFVRRRNSHSLALAAQVTFARQLTAPNFGHNPCFLQSSYGMYTASLIAESAHSQALFKLLSKIFEEDLGW